MSFFYLLNLKFELFIVSNRFDQNSDFDKCITNKFKISINLIEIIEISSGQHYLSIHTHDERIISKLVTFDVYETQAFSSVLLSMLSFFYKF